MTSKRDYYAILGVSKNASLEEIKAAYRQAALAHHPDRVPEAQKKSAEETFKEISEAYAVLSDPQKRAVYDQYGHGGIDQKYAYEDIFKGADFSSVFGDLGEFGLGATLFDRIFGDFGFDPFRGSRRTSAAASRGRDLQIVVRISLEEAYKGCEKLVAFNRYDYDGSRKKTTRKLTVQIPPGVDTGAELRLQAEGEKGLRGAGDLFLILEIEPHPTFQRTGDDLQLQLPVALTTALLGGKIKVPTLSGMVEIDIPPSTQASAHFRLRGKGMPKLRQSGHGDLIASVVLQIPQNLTNEEKALIEQFAKLRKEC